MKYLFVVFLCIFVSCKKDDTPGEPELPLNTFRIGDTSYTVTRYRPIHYWEVATGESITLNFRQFVGPGKYRISDNYDTAPNTVVLAMRLDVTQFLWNYSISSERKELTVRMEGGNAIFSFPKVWVKHAEYSKDSMQISGNLKADL